MFLPLQTILTKMFNLLIIKIESCQRLRSGDVEVINCGVVHMYFGFKFHKSCV